MMPLTPSDCGGVPPPAPLGLLFVEGVFVEGLMEGEGAGDDSGTAMATGGDWTSVSMFP